jgi:hypothetical protein
MVRGYEMNINSLYLAAVRLSMAAFALEDAPSVSHPGMENSSHAALKDGLQVKARDCITAILNTCEDQETRRDLKTFLEYVVFEEPDFGEASEIQFKTPEDVLRFGPDFIGWLDETPKQLAAIDWTKYTSKVAA